MNKTSLKYCVPSKTLHVRVSTHNLCLNNLFPVFYNTNHNASNVCGLFPSVADSNLRNYTTNAIIGIQQCSENSVTATRWTLTTAKLTQIKTKNAHTHTNICAHSNKQFPVILTLNFSIIFPTGMAFSVGGGEPQPTINTNSLAHAAHTHTDKTSHLHSNARVSVRQQPFLWISYHILK